MKNIFTITLMLFSFMAVSQEYDKEWDLVNGYKRVKKNEKFGFLDENGKVVIKLQYDLAYNFHPGGFASVEKDGKRGVINGKNKIIVPLAFKNVYIFSYANVVVTLSADSLWGLYSTEGVELIKPEFNGMDKFTRNGTSICKKNGKFRLIYSTGKVGDISFDEIYGFAYGFALYAEMVDEEKLYGYIDSTGKKYPARFTDASSFKKDGLAVAASFHKYGFINRNIEEEITLKYNLVEPFVNDTAKVILRGIPGVINRQEKFKASTNISYNVTYPNLKGFGLTPVKYGPGYGYLNDAKKLVIPLVFEEVTKFNDRGFTRIKQDGKWGVINSKAEYILDCEYSKIWPLDDSACCVQYEGSLKIYNLYSKKDLGLGILRITEIGEFKNGKYVVKGTKDDYNLKGYLTQSGKFIQTSSVKIGEEDILKINPVVAKMVGTTSKMYNLTGVDTLHYGNGYKQLACIKENDDFAIISGILTQYDNDRDQKPTKGGYTMSKIKKVDGKYTRTDYTEYIDEQDFKSYSEGFTHNTFVKYSGGYLSCTPRGFNLFDNEGKYVKSVASNKHLFFSVAHVPNTNQFVFLAVTGVSKTDNGGQRFGIGLYDMDKGFTHFKEIRNMYFELWRMSAYSTKIFVTPDNQILFTYAVIENNGRQTSSSEQRINKIDLQKFIETGETYYKWNSRNEEYYIRHMEIAADGKISGLMVGRYYRYDIISFTADANAKTRDDFFESFKAKSTPKGEDQITPYFVGAYPLKNGKWMTVGPGDKDDGYLSTIAMCLYDSEMSLIRQYRIPTRFEDFNSRIGDTHINTVYGAYRNYKEGSEVDYGIAGLINKNMLSNADVFYKMNVENCVYKVFPGDNDNEIYVMTAYAIMKIDLTKFVECKLKSKKEEDYSSSDDSSSDDNNSSDNSSTSTNSTNKTNTTKANTTTKVSTKCKILNDLKPIK